MKDQILRLIDEKQLTTPDICDALGNKVNVFHLKSLLKHRVVGEIEYLSGVMNSMRDIHKDLQNVREDKILFIDSYYCTNALFGHLMAEYAFRCKKALAVVVNGCIRDIDMMDYPVWYETVNPVVCDKREVQFFSLSSKKEKYQNGISVCDQNGVVIVESSYFTQDTYQKLCKVYERNVNWYDRLRNGESTFSITCV